MNALGRLLAATFIVGLLAGAAPGAGTGYRSIRVSGGGTIAGTVRTAGEIPTLPAMEITKDEKWCGTRKASPRLTGKNGGVKNAVVSLVAVKEGRALETESKVVLRQSECEFHPHVAILPLGSTLEIVNDDAILHNVRTSDTKGKTIFNIAQPVKGLRFGVNASKFTGPGIYEVSCDAGHPWMSAHIVVTEHPYVAVTDENGRFELTGVPPGTYAVQMWHEGIAVRRMDAKKQYAYEDPYTEVREVVLAPGGKVNVDFALSVRPEAFTRR